MVWFEQGHQPEQINEIAILRPNTPDDGRVETNVFIVEHFPFFDYAQEKEK